MSQTSDKVISRLNGKKADGTDDDRNAAFTGIRKEWDVEITDCSANVQTDTTVGNLHVEQFTINAKWRSHVRKDRYVLGAVADQQWGDDKKPFGGIKLQINALNGGITSDVIVTVDGFDDEPNQYARGKADNLVRGILAHIQEG